jgi:hypothetical protein
VLEHILLLPEEGVEVDEEHALPELTRVVRQWRSEDSGQQDNGDNRLVAGLDTPGPSHTE